MFVHWAIKSATENMQIRRGRVGRTLECSLMFFYKSGVSFLYVQYNTL
jgi:hypothetical protein